MATHSYETETTLIVTNEEGAEYRIPVDHKLDIIHGPFIRDGGASIAWTVPDMTCHEYEWPDGFESINQVHLIDRRPDPAAAYRSLYRQHVMFPMLTDLNHRYFIVLIDPERDEFSLVSHREAAQGARWTHLVRLERAQGWDCKGHVEDWLHDAGSFFRGDVYGVFEAYRDDDGEWVVDSSWGYVGWEHAQQEASGHGTMKMGVATLA